MEYRIVVRAVVLVTLLVTAGCVSVRPDSPSGDGGTTAANGTRVTVTEVVDGDTIDVKFADGTTERVRLLGVDTPEVRGGTNPFEYEGVPDTAAGRACLSAVATNASAFATSELHSREVLLVYDEVADRRGGFGRLLAYVVVDGENFNRRLVASGYARVYDTEFTKSESFYAAEARAMEQAQGVWACRNVANHTTNQSSADGLTIATIHADAAGNDNDNLNDEYVTIENAGTETRDLTGWTVSDEAGHTYTFDALVLSPGKRVTLYTGAGTDNETARYWNAEGAIWNNGGDTVLVRDLSGQLVVSRAYT